MKKHMLSLLLVAPLAIVAMDKQDGPREDSVPGGSILAQVAYDFDAAVAQAALEVRSENDAPSTGAILQGAVSQFEKRFCEQFTIISGKVDALDKRLESLEARVAKAEIQESANASTSAQLSDLERYARLFKMAAQIQAGSDPATKLLDPLHRGIEAFKSLQIASKLLQLELAELNDRNKSLDRRDR